MATFTLKDGTQANIESNDEVINHLVTAQGEYLGLVATPNGQGSHIAPCGPPDQSGHWRWSFEDERWVMVRPIEAVRADAILNIDRAAGKARMRYITEVPGQAGTYLVKAEQAAAFVAAAGQGDVPPYIQAEADATGLTVLEAAQYIAAIAASWSDQLGPAIERERRRGKVLVDAAETVEEIEFELQSARAALDAI